jgi:hypothetical protein
MPEVRRSIKFLPGYAPRATNAWPCESLAHVTSAQWKETAFLAALSYQV